jgi:hypothetical protein
MTEIEIIIRVHRMTDNSDVYHVELGNVDLPAVTEQDAVDLAEGLGALVERHTNDYTTVRYAWAV